MSPESVPPLAACRRIAESQHGLVSAAQAEAAGLSPHAVRRRVRSGVWERVRPSVYSLWTPSGGDAIWRQRLMAGTLWLGVGSAASHRAASVVLELDGLASAPIELSTTGLRQDREAGLIVHRVRSLPPDEIEIRDGIPVTSPSRTLVDLCTIVDPRVVEVALESVIRRGMASVESIRATLRRSRRRSGCGRVLGPLLDVFELKATDSALEAIVWIALRESGMPKPLRQYEVLDRGGHLVGRLDFAYPKIRLGIEADGYDFHSKRRDWQRDRARQNALTRLGWRIYRVTWDDVTRRRRQVLAEVALLLSESARSAEA